MSSHEANRQAIQYLGMVTQLGLNIIFPILLCLLFGNWLQRRFALGQWVVLLFLVLGIAGALNSAVNYLHKAWRDAKQREQEERED